VHDVPAVRSVLRAVLHRLTEAVERVLLRSGYTRRFVLPDQSPHDLLLEDMSVRAPVVWLLSL
jgi:hypothetical protein